MKKINIEQANKQFNLLPKWKQRVAIAKDVLKQIKARKFKIKNSVWAQTGQAMQHNARTLDQNSLTSPNAPVCKCCAIGAAMLSSVRLANECEIEMGYASSDQTINQIGKFFSKDQVRLIELAFETGTGAFSARDCDLEMDAVDFGERFINSSTRARAIFTNIIKNKGTFKP